MKIALAFAATILSLTTLDAQATTPAGAAAIEVKFSDLDLDRKAGVVTLYQRIQGAARQVCESQDGRRIAEQRSHASCVDNAITAAVIRVNSPLLSNYVAQLAGKPVGGTSVAAR